MLIKMKINPDKKESFVIMDSQDLKAILDANISKENIEIVRDTYGNTIKTYLVVDDVALSFFITPDDEISGCSFS